METKTYTEKEVRCLINQAKTESYLISTSTSVTNGIHELLRILHDNLGSHGITDDELMGLCNAARPFFDFTNRMQFEKRDLLNQADKAETT